MCSREIEYADFENAKISTVKNPKTDKTGFDFSIFEINKLD